MFCVKCGAQISDGVRFCASCGNPVVAAQAADKGGQGRAVQDTGPRQRPEQQPQAVSDERPDSGRQRRPGRKRRIVLGCAVAAVVAVVVVAAVLLVGLPSITAATKTTITVTDSITFNCSGFNGDATASIGEKDAWLDEALEVLEDEAEDDAELQEWKAAINSVSVSYEISPKDGLSNGDTVSVTATIENEEALEGLPVKLEAEELKFTVSDLEEVQVIDLFANVELSYEGIGPLAVPSVSGSCDYVKVEYSCDEAYVDNGDTVVVTATYDADALLAVGYRAEADTKEYTVSGIRSYVSAIADIPDDDMAKMKSQAEDVLAAHIAGDWNEENQEFYSKEFLGCYLLTPKSTTSGYTGNYLYLVYKVEAWNKSDGDYTYYVAFAYEDLQTLEDGTLSYDLDACAMTNKKLISSNLFYWCYGYGSLESLFNAYVTAKADYWTYESTVSED